jgi:glucose/arabinose dehydrogenase
MMRTLNLTALPRLAAATLLATMLAGCSRETKPLPPEATPAIEPAPAPAPDASTPAPDATPAPEAMPPDATPPADTAPPPTDPAATAKPTSAQVPDLDSMRLAKTSGKLGVSADVRYSFDSATAPGQPVTLNIAVVPRVAGQNLEFSLQPDEGVEAAAGPVSRLKVGQVDTLRQQYSITRNHATPRTLRVLVTHQWDGGSAFGFYSIPFD